MKTFRLLIVALLVASSAAAQNNTGKGTNDEYSPTVYLISVNETETVEDCGCPALAAAELNRLAAASAIQDYRDTHRAGFQQAEKPQFIFTTKNNKFSFAVGGFINMRVGYDFEGIVDNIDFIPADIPMTRNYATDQKLMMDATTSRLYLKAIANTRALGRVVVYVDGDFRGGARNSYVPRLRSAYVSFLGFTLGRDISTFTDLLAAPNTIDFQGPNAYNLHFATMVRWEKSFWNDCMKFGVAAEMPKVSGTYGEYAAPVPQRMPDFPVYLEVMWGPERQSHLRPSAVFRNMYERNLDKNYTTSQFGWGVQASGHIRVARVLDLFFNGVYGEGITPYIQDLAGAGLDFTPVPGWPTHLQTMPMYGWQAAAQINLSRRVSFSGGYSTVEVCKKNGFYSNDEYRTGEYIFGNMFVKITPRCKFGVEYLYGTRENMDGLKNHANRANMMVQYNF